MQPLLRLNRFAVGALRLHHLLLLYILFSDKHCPGDLFAAFLADMITTSFDHRSTLLSAAYFTTVRNRMQEKSQTGVHFLILFEEHLHMRDPV